MKYAKLQCPSDALYFCIQVDDRCMSETEAYLFAVYNLASQLKYHSILGCL